MEEGPRGLLWGILIGLGAGYLVREVLPPFKETARPLAKAGIKSSLIAVERGREAMAHLSEQFDDLLAEAVAERRIEELQRVAADRRREREEGASGEAPKDAAAAKGAAEATEAN